MKSIQNSDFFETLRHSKNYLSADIVLAAISFISIPIFTRLLTRADYGIVAVFTVYVIIMRCILSLNSYTAVGRYYYEKTNDFGEFIGTTLIFVSVIFGLTVLVYILFYRQIVGLMQLPRPLPIYLLFVCLFSIIYTIYYQILIPQKRSRELATINILKGCALLAFGVLFVYLLRENRYLGKIWATLLIGFVFSIYFTIKIFKYSKFSFNIKHIKYIVNYSIPLIPYALSSVVLSQFDRIMVNDIINSAQAGLYSLGYNIGILLLVVIDATQKAILPDFYTFLDNKEYNRLDALIKKVFSIVTVIALGLILFAREIVILLADKKFHPALSVVPVVVIGYVFFGMSTVYNRCISYKKRTFYLSIIVVMAGILNIVLNAIFIPKYGYIAAAYTTVVSYFIMFLLSWLVAKQILKQRITPLWVICKPALIMFCFIAIFLFLNALDLNPYFFFAIKLIILAVFTLTVFYKELRSFLNLANKRTY